nr:hypothetical protein [Tanacetum cinerariifolium]
MKAQGNVGLSKVLASLFSEVGVIYVNWICLEHCIECRGDDGEEGNHDDDDDEQNDDDQEDDDDDDQEDEGNDKNDQEEGSNDEQARDKAEFIHSSLSTHAEEETRDEESFDPILKTPENTDDEGNGEENLGMNVGREEGQDKEDVEDELYRDVNINLGRGVQMADVRTTQEFEDSHVTLTPVNPDGQQQSSSVTSQFVTSMLNPTPDAGIESIFESTSQMDVHTPTQLCDEAQKENDEFLKTIDENMQKIIKEQVKEQVKMNLYKALVEAYEPDKIFLDIYGDTVTLKRRRDDDADKDEEPFAGSDWGSKRRREGNEPESTSAPREKSTRSAVKSTQGSKS